MKEPALDPALVDKLNEASAKRRYYPYDQDQIDWSIPLTDDWWYAPQKAIPFYGMKIYDDFDEATRRHLSRCRAASLAQAGMLIEQTLTRGFLQLLVAYDARWAASRYMLHELAEEAQHMLMFGEWLRRLGMVPPAPPALLRAGSPLVAFSAVQMPVPFFVVVLTGELTTDLLQSDAAEQTELHPTLRQMLRLHHVEEARHIAFAKDFLEKQFQALSRPERQAVRLIAPAVAGAVARTLTTVPRYDGLPRQVTDAHLREASHSDARATLLKRAFRPLVRYFEEVGIITGRERPLWRQTHVMGDL